MENQSIILRGDADIVSDNSGLPLNTSAIVIEEVRVGTYDVLIGCVSRLLGMFAKVVLSK